MLSYTGFGGIATLDHGNQQCPEDFSGEVIEYVIDDRVITNRLGTLRLGVNVGAGLEDRVNRDVDLRKKGEIRTGGGIRTCDP